MEKYSYSKLDTYVSCPFKYYLQYVLGNYAYTDSPATLFGSAIHKVEETIANNIINKETINYEEIKNNLIRSVEEIQLKFPIEFLQPDKAKLNYIDKLKRYLNSGIYKLNDFLNKYPDLQIVGAEIPFSTEYSTKSGYICNLHGYIDRVFYDTNSKAYLIQDIKTYSKPLTPDKLQVPLQFVVYTLAGKKLYDTDIQNIYCQYTMPLINKIQGVNNPNFMLEGTKKLDSILDSINRQDFYPEPTCLCAWCQFSKTNPDALEDYKYLCPYYSKWTRENKNKNDIYKSANTWMGLENHKEIQEAYLRKNGKDPNIKLNKLF